MLVEYHSACLIYICCVSSLSHTISTVTAIDATGLGDVLKEDGTFTIFAPPNSAFEKLPADRVTKLLDPTWQPQLQDVLAYHALGSEVLSTDLSDGLTAATLNFQGEEITINLDPARVNEVSNILVDAGLVDIEADNGVSTFGEACCCMCALFCLTPKCIFCCR